MRKILILFLFRFLILPYLTCPTTYSFGGGSTFPSVTARITSNTSALSTSLTGAPVNGVGPYVYSWVFGDGRPSASHNPIHNYISAGAHTITLILTHSASQTVTALRTVLVTGPTYYVSKNGSDSNDGTMPVTADGHGPFLTLTKCQTAMESGTTKVCTVESGTYLLSANLIFTSSDTDETWLPASGLNTVTIDGATSYYIAGRNVSGLSIYGFTFQHLVQDAADGGGVAEEFYIKGSNYTIRWNTFLSCAEGCIGGGGFSNSLIDSNTFNGQKPGNKNGTSNFLAAIMAGGNASNNTISHNLCENLDGGCVELGTSGGSGNEMLNNVVTLNIANGADESCRDCGAFYFYDPTGGSTRDVYSYNEVFNNNNGGEGKGVSAFYEDQGTSNFLLMGNICSKCGDWALKLSCPVGGSVHVNRATNNVLDVSNLTVNSGGTAMIRDYECSGGGGNAFENNIVYSSGSWPSYGFWWLSPKGTGRPTVNGNLYYSPTGNAPNPSGIYDGGGATDTRDAKPFNGSPLFANPSANNYTISTNSPAYSDIGWVTLPTNQGPVDSPFVNN